MICDMLDNSMVEPLLRIPSLDSPSAILMIELHIPAIARSESTPVKNDSQFQLTRDCPNCVENTTCTSSKPNQFCRDAKSCPAGLASSIKPAAAHFTSKRAHNFLVGLQLHQEGLRTKACKDSLDASDHRGKAGIHRLLSAELWDALLQ